MRSDSYVFSLDSYGGDGVSKVIGLGVRGL